MSGCRGRPMVFRVLGESEKSTDSDNEQEQRQRGRARRKSCFQWGKLFCNKRVIMGLTEEEVSITDQRRNVIVDRAQCLW